MAKTIITPDQDAVVSEIEIAAPGLSIPMSSLDMLLRACIARKYMSL